MRFAFVEEHRRDIPVNRLCEIMGVSPRGFRTWRSCRASRRQRTAIVLLGHIREQFRLSLGSYGSINAAVETLFKTIKAELIWRQSWPA